MPQFDTSTFVSQIFWLVLCFATLCIAMRFFLIPRLEKSMHLRSRQIRDDQEYAQELQSESSRITKEGDDRLRKARHEASDLIRKQVEEIHAEKVMILHDFELSLQTKVEEAKQDILKQSFILRNDLGQLIEETVSDLNRKLLPDLNLITDKDIKAVVNDLTGGKKKEATNDI